MPTFVLDNLPEEVYKDNYKEAFVKVQLLHMLQVFKYCGITTRYL